MEQYEKAKLLNMAIEKRLWDQSRVVACPASESPAQKEEKKPEEPQDRVPEKKMLYAKRLEVRSCRSHHRYERYMLLVR